MLGYSYEDIQGFGSTLRLAELMAMLLIASLFAVINEKLNDDNY
jgi:hypothetical protein